MKPIVRFAPSPTGFLHVGGARTAIFNWIIAKKLDGEFRLRIEDTDRERSTSESIRQIISGLKWLGLDWDDTIVFQGERADRHREVVLQLINNNSAYRCFCSPQELEEKRKYAEKNKINKRYDGACRNLSATQIQSHLDNNTLFSIRFKIETKELLFNDLIHGERRTLLSDMDDFILQRSDMSPVYQLAVVVDDHDMDVNLVLRGDDHLSNTAKQILIYNALDWPAPQFGHLPLILGSDKVRLSKRHGATSVEEFAQEGILPEALFNYLCLLGWNPGDDREKMDRDEIVNLFESERINNTPAVFDIQKLLWFNAKYVAALPFDQLLAYVQSWMAKRNFEIRDDQEEGFFFYLKLMQVRSRTLNEFYDSLPTYFVNPLEYSAKGVNKFLKKEGIKSLVVDLRNKMEAMDEAVFYDINQIEEIIRSFAASREISAAKIIHPLRLALTGKMESAGIFELIHILGRKKVIIRIQNMLDFLQQDEC